MYAKTPRVKSKKHLIYISKMRCCLADVDFFGCTHNVQAHHLLKPFQGFRGMGMKSSDSNVVPLCQYHHHLIHDVFGDEDKFWKHFNLKEDYGRNLAEKLWQKSPYK